MIASLESATSRLGRREGSPTAEIPRPSHPFARDASRTQPTRSVDCMRTLATTSALAANRPRLDALRAQNVLSHPDLLLPAGLVRRAAASVGTPGAHGELQAAVITVTSGNRPVAAGLALRNGIPVDAAFRIRGSSPQGQWRHSERAGKGCQTDRLTDVLHYVPFAKRAPTTPARTHGRSCLLHRRGRWAAPSRSGAAAGGMKRLAGQQARRPSKALPRLLVLRQPRLTRRFLLLKLFAPFEAVWTVQKIGRA